MVFRIAYRFSEKLTESFVLFRLTTVNGMALFTITDSDEPGRTRPLFQGYWNLPGKFQHSVGILSTPALTPLWQPFTRLEKR